MILFCLEGSNLDETGLWPEPGPELLYEPILPMYSYPLYSRSVLGDPEGSYVALREIERNLNPQASQLDSGEVVRGDKMISDQVDDGQAGNVGRVGAVKTDRVSRAVDLY